MILYRKFPNYPYDKSFILISVIFYDSSPQNMFLSFILIIQGLKSFLFLMTYAGKSVGHMKPLVLGALFSIL